jgi:hypothetical protein
MSRAFHAPGSDNVNVTLAHTGRQESALLGKQFPCCVCGTRMEIRFTQKKNSKPYCVCINCGIQIFFRGKAGISRLNKIIENELFITGKDSNASVATVLFNRIQVLKSQKADLEVKQGLIIRDSDLKNAIRAIEIEIERAQRELGKLGRKTSREKIK